MRKAEKRERKADRHERRRRFVKLICSKCRKPLVGGRTAANTGHKLVLCNCSSLRVTVGQAHASRATAERGPRAGARSFPSRAAALSALVARSIGPKLPELPEQWARLVGDDLRANPEECVRLFKDVQGVLGGRALEAHVETTWDTLSSNGRRNLAYAAHDPSVLSTRLLVRLFRRQASTVEDRHRLLAALAASARHRTDAAGEIKGLVEEVGAYSDDRRQRTLNRFLAAVREAFPA